MENKYLVNEDSVRGIFEEISMFLKRHTSDAIQKDLNDKLINPNNYVTTEAVVNFKQDQASIESLGLLDILEICQ